VSSFSNSAFIFDISYSRSLIFLSFSAKEEVDEDIVEGESGAGGAESISALGGTEDALDAERVVLTKAGGGARIEGAREALAFSWPLIVYKGVRMERWNIPREE